MGVHTVDYIVSIAIVSMLLTTSVMITSQQLSNAWEYQQDQLTTITTVDLLNYLLQHPGYPFDWGQSSITPTQFGLKSSSNTLTMPSPFTPFRLMRTSHTTVYEAANYRNLTTPAYNLFLRDDDYLEYTLAHELLMVDPAYEFQIRYQPLLTVTIHQITATPLALGVSVTSVGGPVIGANLNASLFYINHTTPYPTIPAPLKAHTVTNIDGGAELDFASINASETPYTVLVRVNLGGIKGCGFHTNTPSQTPLIPLVTSYSEGQVSLIHQQNVTTEYPYGGDVYYNLTYLIQIGNTDFRAVNIGTSEGVVKNNHSASLNLQVGLPGVLLITSRTTDDQYGLILMPWGISPIGLSIVYGAESINQKTIVTRSHHVFINGLSYLVEIACWRRIEG